MGEKNNKEFPGEETNCTNKKGGWNYVSTIDINVSWFPFEFLLLSDISKQVALPD